MRVSSSWGSSARALRRPSCAVQKRLRRRHTTSFLRASAARGARRTSTARLAPIARFRKRILTGRQSMSGSVRGTVSCVRGTSAAAVVQTVHPPPALRHRLTHVRRQLGRGNGGLLVVTHRSIRPRQLPAQRPFPQLLRGSRAAAKRPRRPSFRNTLRLLRLRLRAARRERRAAAAVAVCRILRYEPAAAPARGRVSALRGAHRMSLPLRRRWGFDRGQQPLSAEGGGGGGGG